MVSKFSAELIGTFWLVLGGCGSAVLAAAFPDVGIGLLGVSLAFGLTVLTGAYALGPISGGHFNPAVSALACGQAAAFPPPCCCPTSSRRSLAASSAQGCCTSSRAAARTSAWRAASPPTAMARTRRAGTRSAAGLVCEVVMTFMFLIIILGTTHKRAPVGFAGLAIGLGLTLIHLVSIPVTNTSVNPARSTATALFVGRLGPSAALDVLGCSGDWRRPRWLHTQAGPRRVR